jgi:hypothetical protein
MREPSPRRVRNIFICGRSCSGLVEDRERWFKRAAAHVRERRDLDDAVLLESAVTPRSRAGRRARRRPAQYGLSFACTSPGRKPRRSPASTTGRVITSAAVAGAQRAHGRGDGEVRLARAGDADAEDERALLDRLEVAALVLRARFDGVDAQTRARQPPPPRYSARRRGRGVEPDAVSSSDGCRSAEPSPGRSMRYGRDGPPRGDARCRRRRAGRPPRSATGPRRAGSTRCPRTCSSRPLASLAEQVLRCAAWLPRPLPPRLSGAGCRAA